MDMDKLISNVLRTGVIISLILILIGTVLLFADNGSNSFTMAQIINVNSKINSSIFSIAGMVNGLFSLQGADFILLGIIVLILTPITRVITSVLSFLYERNWLYVIITVIVFIDIMVAIFIVPVILGH